MSKEEKMEALTGAVLEYDGNKAKDISSELLGSGVDPLQIIEKGLSKGMAKVGDKFDNLEIYLPELMMAAEAFNEAMEVLEPAILEKEEVEVKGTVVLGTVEGDVHAIGKSIVGMMLKTGGFEVHDLGVEVESSTFIKKAEELRADIIGLSSLLTTTMSIQREVIQMLDELGKRQDYLVIVGGAPTNQDWANEIGADGYAENAGKAVKLAQRLIEDQKTS